MNEEAVARWGLLRQKQIKNMFRLPIVAIMGEQRIMSVTGKHEYFSVIQHSIYVQYY